MLGGFPPPLDEFDKRLPAVAQAMAFLELVKKGNHLIRQFDQDFLFAGRGNATPVGADMLSYGRLAPHDGNPAPFYL